MGAELEMQRTYEVMFVVRGAGDESSVIDAVSEYGFPNPCHLPYF